MCFCTGGLACWAQAHSTAIQAGVSHPPHHEHLQLSMCSLQVSWALDRCAQPGGATRVLQGHAPGTVAPSAALCGPARALSAPSSSCWASCSHAGPATCTATTCAATASLHQLTATTSLHLPRCTASLHRLTATASLHRRLTATASLPPHCL